MRNRYWTLGLNRFITGFFYFTPESRYVLAIGIGPFKIGLHIGRRRRYGECTP